MAKISQQSGAASRSQDPQPDVLAEPNYTIYLDPSFSLEARVDATFKLLGIPSEMQRKVMAMLAPLEVKDRPTFEHCLRVGLLARRIGAHLQIDEKALFYAGLMHDAGKALTPTAILKRTDGWAAEDQEAIIKHVIDGYNLLSGVFDFSAGALLYHHTYQPNPYPTTMPDFVPNYSEGSKQLLQELGRVIAIADTFDALHRINSKHGKPRALTGEEIKQLMSEFHSDRLELIEDLFRQGVLTTFILGEEHLETINLDSQDFGYDEAFQFTDAERSARNTQRHIALAVAIEPLSEKYGATTRYRDASSHLRLEYLVASAINIGDAFSGLAQEVAASQTAPNNLYRFGLQAQIESNRNRRGGPVNQGIIELLVPIVAAQHLYDTSYFLSHKQILDLAEDYLKNTTRLDVNNLIKLKQTALNYSHYNNRIVPEHADSPSVSDYYNAELLNNSSNATSLAHNSEFLSKFPTISLMCDTILDSPYPHYNQRVEEAFLRARYKHNPDVAVGFLADCIAVSSYLIVSQNPKIRILG